MKKPCTRCLLEQAGEVELAQAIRERIAAMPQEERADSKLYEKRLEKCRECGFLSAGTCLKCGCYAELRAAKAGACCPHEKKMW